ncbi:MAG: cytidine deaminase [Chloroflexia bacterium]|nr:cytidine deaminase [Chloroflexia bacterium]MDQ3412357.1 cytidine deaminase [Chloroflexota bacterium]
MLDQETAARLLRDAHAAAARAYVPYSRFPVGAALLTTDGTTSMGCNIENASYGLTVCAERVAVFNAVANGARAVVAIAVVAADIDGVTPCGACRQVLNEFVPPDGELIVVLERDGKPEQTTLAALLPHAFGPRDLASP